MVIPTTALPDASPWIHIAYCISMDTVVCEMQQIAPFIYAQAVYYLAGSTLLNFAPDTPPSTFFADYRKANGMLSFVAGVISESHDETTGQSMLVADWFKNLTMANLQQLKDPYGRQYLAWAQDFGSLWGVS